MTTNPDIETPTKILLSAGELFASFGFHGTSIRAVTQKAKVNLAAIHYHFGDKKSLYCSVISNQLRPINQVRLVGLANALKYSGDKPIPLSLLVDIYARPLFDLCVDDPNGLAMIRLLGRSMIEPLPFVDKLLAEELHPVTAQFAQAIRRHVHRLTPEGFMWRVSFVVGAMHHTLATMHRMRDLTRGLCRDNDAETALRQFVQLATATLSAPIEAGS